MTLHVLTQYSGQEGHWSSGTYKQVFPADKRSLTPEGFIISLDGRDPRAIGGHGQLGTWLTLTTLLVLPLRCDMQRVLMVMWWQKNA